MLDFTTFGEGGLRLSVPIGRKLETANRFDASVSGTEANVAGILSQLGWNCGWVSALPDNETGRRVVSHYRSFGIDLSSVILRDDGRTGIYFVEYASPPRPTKVLFDRKNTCLSKMTVNEVDWNYLLNSQHIHMSGITAALSKGCLDIVATALEKARQAGISTSFDVNYRSLLWSTDEAREILIPIIGEVDLLFCSKRDAENVLLCSGEPGQIIEKLSELSNAGTIVLTLGQQGVIGWDGKRIIEQGAMSTSVIDRIGAGDAMLAGVLHGLREDNLQLGLAYGSNLASMALSQFGDLPTVSSKELKAAMEESNVDIKR